MNSEILIPVYGFLEGDTIGLLVLAYGYETVEQVAKKLQKAAAVRVKPAPHVKLLYKGRELNAELTMLEANIQPLDRIDVVDARHEL